MNDDQQVTATLVWNFGEYETENSLTWENFRELVIHGSRDGDDEVTSMILWPSTSKEFQDRYTKVK